jgi:hypothetical protein
MKKIENDPNLVDFLKVLKSYTPDKEYRFVVEPAEVKNKISIVKISRTKDDKTFEQVCIFDLTLGNIFKSVLSKVPSGNVFSPRFGVESLNKSGIAC